MEIGLCLPTKANSWEVVKRGEELGFASAWFYDAIAHRLVVKFVP